MGSLIFDIYFKFILIPSLPKYQLIFNVKCNFEQEIIFYKFFYVICSNYLMQSEDGFT